MDNIPPWIIEYERKRKERERGQQEDNRIPLELPLYEIPYTSSSIDAPKSTVITFDL